MSQIVIALVALLCGAGCASSLRVPVVNYDPVVPRVDRASFAGSGFIWNRRYVLTSSHSCTGDSLEVVFRKGFLSGTSASGRVIRRVNDLALIDLGADHSFRSLRLASEDPYPGQRLWIVDGSRPSRPEIEARAISADSLRVLEGEVKIRRGSSGSPVVDDKGEVVGIVFASLRLGGQDLVSLHPISEILQMLQGVFPGEGSPVRAGVEERRSAVNSAVNKGKLRRRGDSPRPEGTEGVS